MKLAVTALVIACWTTAALLYRLAARTGLPRGRVALGASGAWFVLTLVTSAVTGASPLSEPGVLFALGALGGVCIVLALPFFMAAVARGNLAVSWTILTLSFAASALVSIIYPGSPVNGFGVAGLATAGAAIVLLGRDGASRGAKAGFRRGWGLFMALAFMANAATMYVYPLADAWADIKPLSAKMAMLLAQTAVFLAGSALLCLRGRPKRGWAAIGVGACLGAVFAVGNYARMVALGDLDIPAYVFFPAATGGSTLTVAFISSAVFGERPGLLGWLGLALGLGAMVLLASAA